MSYGWNGFRKITPAVSTNSAASRWKRPLEGRWAFLGQRSMDQDFLSLAGEHSSPSDRRSSPFSGRDDELGPSRRSGRAKRRARAGHRARVRLAWQSSGLADGRRAARDARGCAWRPRARSSTRRCASCRRGAGTPQRPPRTPCATAPPSADASAAKAARAPSRVPAGAPPGALAGAPPGAARRVAGGRGATQGRAAGRAGCSRHHHRCVGSASGAAAAAPAASPGVRWNGKRIRHRPTDRVAGSCPGYGWRKLGWPSGLRGRVAAIPDGNCSMHGDWVIVRAVRPGWPHGSGIGLATSVGAR